ncbi:PQQ-dependent sugar dehydrogenase [Membranihabitans marinus]|uniref:PQQ-dependent sugar dehydrogenase n=1 Tax=Membranihabitans marinus TaxID=1227546 RepID=UPI001F2C535D|nr:PQQ-dependent sugar dehydrogenase [Membranihabitans marinus]
MKFNFIFGLLLLAIGCQNGDKQNYGKDISSDALMISQGQKIFVRQCSSCHDFKQKGIGPNLSGVTRSVSSAWLKGFIADPAKVIKDNDARAVALYEEFKAVMPGFSSLTDVEMESLLSYMHTYEKTVTEVLDTVPSILNPYADTASFADVSIDLEFITQVPASHTEAPLARINKLECVGDRTLVCDLRGRMYELKNGKTELFFSMEDEIKDFVSEPGLASGLGSFVFHPDFATNGLWYTVHTEPGNTRPADFQYEDSIAVMLQGVVTEWKMDDVNDKVFSGKKRELLRVDYVTGIHGMQELNFNPTAKKGDADYGMLYIGMGDGGSTHKGYSHICNHRGQRIWSSVIRIDPQGNNSDNGKYGIPVDNPYVGEEARCQEIYAYGFRNPNRITWDNRGRMIVSDIGQAHIEEINIVRPGGFYGWPIREGEFTLNPYGNQNKIYPLPENDDDYQVVYPITAYDHDDGLAISGGFIMENGDRLKGKYVFGDITSGKIFFTDLDGKGKPVIQRLAIYYNNKKTTLREMSGKWRQDLRFGRDCAGDIYVMTKADGRIYRLKEQK